MIILSIGSMNGISNTCVHRNWALESIADKVDVVDTSAKITIWFRIAYHLFLYGLPVKLPDTADSNKRIKTMVSNNPYDLIWIDKGVTIEASTLQYIKTHQPNAIIVSYSPDEMALRHNQSQQYIEGVPFYDYIVTTKSYIIDDMKSLGAKNVIFVNNAYEKRFHHLYDMTQDDYDRLGADVGFVGSYEKERCDSLLYLADHGLKVTVWGAGRKWKRYKKYNPNFVLHEEGLYSKDYSKSFRAAKISLCFLKKINYDQQTSRSIEIPACGGFMLAERTDEHKALFEEDKEAVYFSSNEELLEKCRYYLDHEDERKAIAEAGWKRCLDSDYSNEGMIRKVLKVIFK